MSTSYISVMEDPSKLKDDCTNYRKKTNFEAVTSSIKWARRPRKHFKSGIPVLKARSNLCSRTPLSTLQLPHVKHEVPLHSTLLSNAAIPSRANLSSAAQCDHTSPFHPDPQSLVGALVTPTGARTTLHQHPTSIPGRFRAPQHRGSMLFCKNKENKERNEEAVALFERQVQTSIKSSRFRSKVVRSTHAGGIDNVRMKLETQLNDVGIKPEKYPNKAVESIAVKTNRKCATTIETHFSHNFYELDEEVMAVKWGGRVISANDVVRCTDPLANLLDKYYFVPL